MIIKVMHKRELKESWTEVSVYEFNVYEILNFCYNLFSKIANKRKKNLLNSWFLFHLKRCQIFNLILNSFLKTTIFMNAWIHLMVSTMNSKRHIRSGILNLIIKLIGILVGNWRKRNLFLLGSQSGLANNP